jgi:hypothetical protein
VDIQSGYAVRLLDTIGKSNSNLIDLSILLRSRNGIDSVINSFQCRTYRFVGTPVSAYVDVELVNGNAFTWGYTISWDEQVWTIESLLSTNDEQGYQVIKRFPVRETEIFDDFLDQLMQVTSELVDDAAAFDFDVI